MYPALMLAVLNERLILDKNYSFLYKNAEIVKKIEIIYNLNHKYDIEVDENFIEIPTSRLKTKHYIVAGIVALVCCLIISLSAVLMIFVTNRNGTGTAESPIRIDSSLEFFSALKDSKRTYLMASDITIQSDEIVSTGFAGVIDGGGYSLTIEGDITAPIISELTGTVKNLNVKLTNNNLKITQNCSIITEKNSGLLENCSVSGNFLGSFDSDNEVFCGMFAANNFGKIVNCSTALSGVLDNKKESNAYFGMFVGVNETDGQVLNCEAGKGILLTDTVDVAALAGVNNGTIKHFNNMLNISQTSSKQWHPNVGGVAVLNYGVIEQSKNSAELSSKSEVSEAAENPFYVFVGGITCENYGSILSCSNSGLINGKGDVSNVVAAGIAARNIKDEKHEGIVKYSLASSNIKAFSELGQVCVGGVVGINSSVVLNSGCVGTIDANSNTTQSEPVFMNEVDKAVAVVSGGVVGVNQNAPIQNSYAAVSFVCGETSENVLKIYSGVVGSIGMYRYSYISNPLLVFKYHAAYMYLMNNFYVDKEEIKQCAYGVYGSLDDAGYYKGGVAEIIPESGNETIMKKCASLDEIPAEVRINA